MRRLLLIVFLLLGLQASAVAQAPDGPHEGIEGQGRAAIDAPGGAEPLTNNPDRVPNRLEQIDRLKDALIPTPSFDRFVQPWYDFKGRLSENLGLDLGFFYTTLYQKADPRDPTPLIGDGRDEASGGIFGIVGQWELLGRRTNSPGILGFQLQQRNRFGAVVPQSLGPEIGSVWPTAIGYSELTFSAIELYWAQWLVKDRLGFAFGKQIPFAVHDYFAYKSPFDGFLNASFGLNQSIGFAEAGLSVNGGVRPTKSTYILGGVYDGNGKLNRAGFDSFFNEREYFTAVDVGWDPGYLEGSQEVYIGPLRIRDIHATIWHKARLKNSDSPEGWGVTLFAEGEIGRVVPFLRYGYSQGTSLGNPALVDDLIAGGVGLTDVFGQSDDLIGIGFSYGRFALGPLGRPDPVDLTGDGIPDIDLGEVTRSLLRTHQYAGEIFYRVQLTQELQITPSLQMIWDPSLNRDEDKVAVFGLRGRADW